jgi:hypothetical protein
MPALICQAAPDKTSSEPQRKQETMVMEGDARSQADTEISEQRKKIVDEAVAALIETKNALRALDQKKTQDALAALERASGKLNIVLSRDPKLALAPVDVEVRVYDIYTTVDAIKKARKQAEDFLESGEVQKARLLIRDLASEMIISVVGLPLRTYPAAISAVAPLIDQNKIEEAKTALQAAINTLVITDHVIPLPLLLTDVTLAKAEMLAQKTERSESDTQMLTKLLNDAREELKFAEALGYGNKKDYRAFYAEIDDIESKTKSGKSGKGFFAQVKQHLSDFRRTILGEKEPVAYSRR